jgi:LPS-assembly protein
MPVNWQNLRKLLKIPTIAQYKPSCHSSTSFQLLLRFTYGRQCPRSHTRGYAGFGENIPAISVLDLVWGKQSLNSLELGRKAIRSGAPFKKHVVRILLIFTLVLQGLFPIIDQARAAHRLDLQLSESPWHVWGDKITARGRNEAEVVIIEGNVRIRQDERVLTADKVRIYTKRKQALAQGNVVLRSPEGDLTGDMATINLSKGLGKVRNGTLFIKEGNYHITGESVVKTGESTYYFLKSSITTCNAASPAWRFKGKEVNLTLDDYATIHGATFEIKEIPVFYTPWIMVPTKTTRQTGLLPPVPGFSSRNGFEFELPFYWAISANSDATFYQYYLNTRGLKEGAEFRYILGPESKGAIMLDYLSDDKKDVDLFDDGLLRTNESRWWIRTRVDHTTESKIQAKVDVDLASDQDYLREFRTGYSGFDAADRYFGKEFGRNLEDETSLFRQSKASLTRNWDQFGLTGATVYYQGLVAEQGDPVFQQLPFLSFSAPLNRWSHLPLFYSLNSDYNYFWREEGFKGHRVDLNPQLSAPVDVDRYFSFIPYVRARQSIYYADDENSSVDNGQRMNLGFGTEFTSHISRVYNWSGEHLKKLKHVVIPSIFYDYASVGQDSDLPIFGLEDEIGSIHQITYLLENNLIGKFEDTKGKTEYRDLMRFRLLQTYEIKEGTGILPTAQDERLFGTEGESLFGTGEERRPFSNVLGQLEVSPWRKVAMLFDTSFDPYESGFDDFNTYVRADDRRGNIVQLDYRYASSGASEQLNSLAQIKVTNNFALLGYNKTSLSGDQTVESGAGFKAMFQCWGVRVLYRTTPDERQVTVAFSLLSGTDAGAWPMGF